jgi:D-alanine-D-alanine ligase
LWEIYEDETPMPNDENFYEYQPAPSELQEAIKELAWRAYVACKGTGYTRADIRMDNSTKKMYVLEVNAQCGLSEDEDYTSIGAILKVSEKSFTSLVSEILYNAISKNQ